MSTKFLLWMANRISSILSRDPISRRVRSLLYRIAGVKIGKRSFLEEGTLILGTKLSIGNHCYINSRCYFDLSASIELKDNVTVGHGVTFVTADHTIGSAERRAGQVISRPIVVGKGSWIGANATILPGVDIGEGSMIAACAVVTRSVLPNTLVAGVPARSIRSLEPALVKRGQTLSLAG